MIEPIKYRISEEDGQRFAVVPLDQFAALLEQARAADNLTFPHAVASRHLVDNVPLIRAWREHLNITQAELARRLNVTQSQIAQWEKEDARPRYATLKRIAGALGLEVGQLSLDDPFEE